MTNLERLSSLIGLAQRAGKVISGEELVVKAIQHQQVILVFLANDAGPNVIKSDR